MGSPLASRCADPVDTVIAIDLTTLTHGDPSLALAYTSTALQAAARTIQRGGLLALEASGASRGKAVNIYATQVPTLAEAGPAARDNAGGDREPDRRAERRPRPLEAADRRRRSGTLRGDPTRRAPTSGP